MICPQCQMRWADFPIDIKKEKMTGKQEAERLIVFDNDDYRLCSACLLEED